MTDASKKNPAFDFSRPFETNGGQPARLLCRDLKRPSWGKGATINLVAVTFPSGDEHVYVFKDDGLPTYDGSGLRLRNKVVRATKTGFVYLHKETGVINITESELGMNIPPWHTLVGTVEVETVDGVFDSLGAFTKAGE